MKCLLSQELYLCMYVMSLPWWLRRWSVCLQYGRPRFNPWVGKIPWRRQWQHTPVFLPGKFHGLRSLVGYSPWRCKESDMTEQLHFDFHFYVCIYMYCNTITTKISLIFVTTNSYTIFFCNANFKIYLLTTFNSTIEYCSPQPPFCAVQPYNLLTL